MGNEFRRISIGVWRRTRWALGKFRVTRFMSKRRQLAELEARYVELSAMLSDRISTVESLIEKVDRDVREVRKRVS